MQVILKLLSPSGQGRATALALAELVDGALETIELVDGLIAFGSEACLELPEGVTCLTARGAPPAPASPSPIPLVTSDFIEVLDNIVLVQEALLPLPSEAGLELREGLP